MKNSPEWVALVSAMYRYYQDNHTIIEVGDKFGYTFQAISHIFRRCGLKMRTAQQTRYLKLHPETIQMYNYYKAGLSLRDVGQRYGVTPQCVQLRFKKAGFQRRPATGAPDNGYDFSEWNRFTF